MVNRIVEMGGIWAEGAPDVPPAPGGIPVPGVTYANTTLTEIRINRAWPYTDVAASNDFNEIIRRMTLLHTQMEKQGVLSYSLLTDYVVGAMVLGFDEIVYRAISISGPESGGAVDPVGASLSIWKKVGTVIQVSTTGLATGTIDYSGIIDVPIADQTEAEAGAIDNKAMTPLKTKFAIDAFVTSATETNEGIAELSDSGEALAGTDHTTIMTPLRVKNAIDAIPPPPTPTQLWTESGSDVYRPTGNVGVGLAPSEAKLDVDGQVKIRGGAPAADKILTCVDASGLATWADPGGGGEGPLQTTVVSGTTPSANGTSLQMTHTVPFANIRGIEVIIDSSQGYIVHPNTVLQNTNFTVRAAGDKVIVFFEINSDNLWNKQCYAIISYVEVAAT